MLNGVHHICIKCNGYDSWQEDVAFYRDVLGFSLVRSWGEGESSGAMLFTGNCLMEVMANGVEPVFGVTRHVAFACDDVPGMLDRVRAAGRPITMEAKELSLGENYPIRVGFCIGPAGEEVEFFHEL